MTLDLLHGHIQDAFNEYGVQIMSPNYEAIRAAMGRARAVVSRAGGPSGVVRHGPEMQPQSD